MNIQDVFGASSTLVGGTLSVQVSELYMLNNATPNAAQLVAAIILGWKAHQPADASDDVTVGVVVGEPFNSIARNDTQLERQYGVSLFTALTIPDVDPDNVV